MLFFALFPVITSAPSSDKQRYQSPTFWRNSWLRRPSYTPIATSFHLTPTKTGQHQRTTASLKASSDWNGLYARDFDDLINQGQLSLCFVGMSNCGKSHWSEQLSLYRGFDRVCVDDEIENAIRPELASLGYAGIAGMAEWMGYPSDDRFTANEKRYLELEEEITSAIVPNGSSNFVLDTTGSVVYLSPQTLAQLRSNFLIVHLAATEDVLEEMRKSYFETPKPVVWGASYNSRASESPIESLRRCYGGLLRERYQRYSELAHIAIPASVSLSREIDVNQFLDVIRSELIRPTRIARS